MYHGRPQIIHAKASTLVISFCNYKYSDVSYGCAQIILAKES